MDFSILTFKLFGLDHILFLVYQVIVLILLYLFRNKIKARPKLVKAFRWFLAISLLSFEIAYYIWSPLYGNKELKQFFPLELCAFSLYFGAYFLIFDSELAWRLSVPFTILGATLACVLGDPEGYNFPAFRFFHFFVGHGNLIVAFLFAYWVMDYKIKRSDFKYTVYFILVAFAIGLVVNYSIGSNFMFLREAPYPVDGIEDLIGKWYVIPMTIGLLSIYYLTIEALALKDNLAKRKEQKLNES